MNAVLDREKIGNYNLSISARDKGTPPRTSFSFLLIQVNDINDHEPIFEQTEYAAVLRELVPVGTYVASISAHDEDTGINAQLYYSIVSGNEGDWFVIDRQSGLLTTKVPLDRELRDGVRLRISARDGGPNPKWAFSEIKITILDENDESPRFELEEMNVSLAETVPIGSTITTLIAIDNDQGTNGSVTYHLDSSTQEHYPGMFHLNPNSGVLLNQFKFDRESVELYDILVIAKDKGSPSLSSTARIHLLITDVNDNEPVLYPKEYFYTLSHLAPGNTTVATIRATDSDEGLNAQLNFRISSDKHNLFHIHASSGGVTLKRSLTTWKEEYFTFSVNVEDGGGKRGAHDAIVHLFLKNPTKPPSKLRFVLRVFNFSFTEDEGTRGRVESRKVGELQLEMTSSGRLGTKSLKYCIVDGDPGQIFRIDNQGRISSNQLVDREAKSEYVLSVVLWDEEDNEYDDCTVNILVKDLNDNSPVFEGKNSEVRINEDAAIGSEVALVLATDPDFKENSTIRYSLSKNPENLFKVQATTGIVTLNKSLLLNAVALPSDSTMYTQILIVEVTAEDGGKPFLSSRHEIHVKVIDVNNYTPVFELGSYETSILESTPLNSRFFYVQAKDSDLGPNSQVSYRIIQGFGGDKFGIFPDGHLFVKNKLDREAEDYYTLTIEASDGGTPPRSSTVPLVLHVIDENDNAPQFTNSTFTFFLTENEEPDTFVGKLKGLDVDSGRNAELTYSLSAQQDFMVVGRSGIMRSLRSFDREELLQTSGKDYLVLEATVTDGGSPSLSDSATIRVYIEDENDNAPVFRSKSYTTQIPEGSPIGSHVIRVLASDSDFGLNGDVVYYFKESKNEDEKCFKVDPTTGQITLAKKLDRESTAQYTLNVIARDLSPTFPLSSTVIVRIQILDDNDNAPEFAQSEPFIGVSEMTSVGKELMQFQATDPDVGLNAEVTLAITGGNKHDVFRIDPRTGSLFLNKKLDFEKQTNYILNITASDSGNPKLSSSLSFSVKVLDFNDNPPGFPSTAIFRQISEGIPINSSIVTISADDPDSGLNGKVKYSISDSEPGEDYFGIHPEDGKIFTLREIDREYTDSFRLTVLATDQAIPISSRLSAEKLVTIIVDDMNDNEPRFESMNAAILHKNSRALAEIIKIRAIDPDSDSNGVVTFEMLSGDSSIFQLDRNSGVLILQNEISDLQPRYQLTIRATDEAIQSQRKSADFYLTVIGIESETGKNSSLEFTSSSFEGSISENEPIGTSVLQVNVLPPSPSQKDSIEYYITNITSSRTGQMVERLFEIDVRTGTIYTTTILDRERGHSDLWLEVYAILVSTKGLHSASTLVSPPFIFTLFSRPPASDSQFSNLLLSKF